MSDTAELLDTPMVPSYWTLSHAAYEAGARIKGVETGCPGVLRITENDGKRPAVATCDVCLFHVGVLQSVLRGDPPSEQRKMIDGWGF